MKKTLVFAFYLALLPLSKSFARIEYVDKLFGEWLVSCKYDGDELPDCFLGSQYFDEDDGGAVIFTNYYMAISHNTLNLSDGVKIEVDDRGGIDSSMNTGINVFFQNNDRMKMMMQMMSGENMYLNISGGERVTMSLSGFAKAYNFYITQ